jgi:hypothetical protein
MWTVNILSRYLPRLARRIELDGFLKLSVLKNDQRSVIVSVPVISTKDLSRLVFAADRHQPARGLKLFVSTLFQSEWTKEGYLWDEIHEKENDGGRDYLKRERYPP